MNKDLKNETLAIAGGILLAGAVKALATTVTAAIGAAVAKRKLKKLMREAED